MGSNIYYNHPLYLHPSDAASGSLSIEIQLKDMENYMLWSRAMILLLLGRNKLGFIDGSVMRNIYEGDLQQRWDKCNAIVVSWLMSSVQSDLLSGILFRADAYLVWNDLKEIFDTVNNSRAYHLHKEITTVVQGISYVSVYYSKLKDLWYEHNSSIPFPTCVCQRSKDFVEHLERQKLF